MSVEQEPNLRAGVRVTLLSGNQGREWAAPEVMASEVGRSQHLGLNSFEVPQQTCLLSLVVCVVQPCSLSCLLSVSHPPKGHVEVSVPPPPSTMFCVVPYLGWR